MAELADKVHPIEIVDPAFSYPATTAALLAQIETQRSVIDARLTGPARWRGPLRRELAGQLAPVERGRVAAAFDRLALGDLSEQPLDLPTLHAIHETAVEGGGAFRDHQVRIGGRNAVGVTHCAPANRVPELVDQAIAHANERVAAGSPVVAAMLLQLDLVLAHPYSDGNGRIARLAAAAVLLRAGYRSTLLTAAEQHMHTDPGAYRNAWARVSEHDPEGLDSKAVETWVECSLAIMASASEQAAWFRERSQRMRACIASIGVSGHDAERALVDFDRGRKRWNRAARALAQVEDPWNALKARRSPRDLELLAWQLHRLRAEEADNLAFAKPARQIKTVLTARPVRSPAVAAREATPPAATVIVPAYHAASTIAACLRGLEAQHFAEPFEVIVVASGEDATGDIVHRGFPRSRVVRTSDRLTPGAARNVGIQYARGAVISFCAADCVPDSHWLGRRVAAHRSGSRVVGGFVDSDTRSNLVGWAQYLAKFGGMQHLTNARLASGGPLFHLSYAREVLETHGPFPEEMVAGEDTLYNHRLVTAGETVLYDSQIRVFHINSRRMREVLAGQREQGEHAGLTCRGTELESHFRHWIRGGPLAPLRAALATTALVARYHPRLLLRCVLALPLTILAHRARMRAFRQAYHSGTTTAVFAGNERSSAITETPPDPFVGRPSVSIVVVAYNEERLIGRCLKSALRQSIDGVEVLLADDGSIDRTREIAARHGVPVLCLPHRGPAYARNIGALSARGDVIVFVDADLELAPDCIERLTAPILEGTCVGTFTKDMWVANTTRPWAACWTHNRGFPPGHVFPPEFPDVWSNFRAVRRADFLEVGGYDDVGYGEDMTLAPKLGVDAVAVPGALMFHNNPDSLREIWDNARWIGRGTRIREINHPWRVYGPWRSARRGVRIARRHRLPRFVIFKIVYDAGVLSSYARSLVAPRPHSK